MAYKTQQLEATVEALGDKLGMYLVPKLEEVAKATEDVIKWFEKHQTAARALATVIETVLGVAVASYAYSKATAFVNATKAMGTGIGALSGKLTAAASTIGEKFGVIGSSSETAAGTVTETGETMQGSLETTAGSFEALGSAATTPRNGRV